MLTVALKRSLIIKSKQKTNRKKTNGIYLLRQSFLLEMFALRLFKICFVSMLILWSYTHNHIPMNLYLLHSSAKHRRFSSLKCSILLVSPVERRNLFKGCPHICSPFRLSRKIWRLEKWCSKDSLKYRFYSIIHHPKPHEIPTFIIIHLFWRCIRSSFVFVWNFQCWWDCFVSFIWNANDTHSFDSFISFQNKCILYAYTFFFFLKKNTNITVNCSNKTKTKNTMLWHQKFVLFFIWFAPNYFLK